MIDKKLIINGYTLYFKVEIVHIENQYEILNFDGEFKEQFENLDELNHFLRIEENVGKFESRIKKWCVENHKICFSTYKVNKIIIYPQYFIIGA